MKKTIWSCLATLIALGSLVELCAQTAPPPAPKIHCDKVLHDFGRVRSGTTLTHEFSISNHGTADLAIHEII